MTDNVTHLFDAKKTMPVTFSKDCGVNTTDDVIIEQVSINIRRGLPQVRPFNPNQNTALLVCGGPSLNMPEIERELVEAVWAGGKVIAVNGAYNWCIEHNIKPSAAVMLDARQFNSRFFERPVDGCKYFLASQCHPDAFEICRGRETFIWHAVSAGQPELDLINSYYYGRVAPVQLGTTVSIRAISVFRMLGWMWFDVFGLDSCWLDNAHHSYAQPENNKDQRIPVWINPKDRAEKAMRFECAPWHMKQIEDFMQLIKERGSMFNIRVRGPGAIAALMRTAAEIQMEEKAS